VDGRRAVCARGARLRENAPMVMGKRADVPTASGIESARALVGLAARVGVALATVPLRRPWRGPDDLAHNLAQATTRAVMRSFMEYAVALPTPALRSVEVALDDLCGVVLPPFVRHLRARVESGVYVGGVPGDWYRPASGEVRATILYFHGGGYVATSPKMYAVWTAWLAERTGCEVFVADYRLAPEFPYPAGMDDAAAVYEATLARGIAPESILFAGDSGGGGLVTSLFQDARTEHLPEPAGVILLSPEVDLVLDEPSVTENADNDILPTPIPVDPYLHGLAPDNPMVSADYANLDGFPPTLVAFGDEEVFRDAIRRFVKRLEAAHCSVEAHEEPDMFHVYMILMPWADASRRLYDHIANFVGAALANEI
jgi:monoterpene epsilon-lactone hydrolase